MTTQEQNILEKLSEAQSLCLAGLTKTVNAIAGRKDCEYTLTLLQDADQNIHKLQKLHKAEFGEAKNIYHSAMKDLVDMVQEREDKKNILLIFENSQHSIFKLYVGLQKYFQKE